MKTILIAATLAALSVTVNTSVQAASTTPLAASLAQVSNSGIDRKGRRCDTPRDIAEHPRCTKA